MTFISPALEPGFMDADWKALQVGMDTHSAEDLQSGFVHLRDLGYSPTGVRKVAVDLSDGEETAIKLIQRGSQVLQAKSAAATSVERDAVIHSQLHHPNIIGFKKIFLSNNTLGIVHEYAAMGTVYDMLKNQGPFPENLARFFFQQLVCGVRYLHERGVAHREIRLKYLLVKSFNFTHATVPVLKITHFAAAKEDSSPGAAHAGPSTSQTRTHSTQNSGGRSNQGSRGNVRSTAEDVLAADKATDVWACGTVLFAMLTAQPPSHTSGTQERSSGGATEAAAEDDAAAGKLVWPDNVQVSDACKNLLEVMLSPHPAERPTIRQVLDHPWYIQDLPRELQGNARGLAHCQAKKCQQPPEEVKELIRQARYGANALQETPGYYW